MMSVRVPLVIGFTGASLLLVPSCQRVPEGEGEGSSTFSTGNGSNGSSGSSSSVSSGESEATGGLDGGFVNIDAQRLCGEACDPWKPGDCADGEKCTALACEVGSNSWDSDACVEILGAQAVGEACEYLGDGIDGLDTCVAGAMCWDQDPETFLGTCVALCGGTVALPECPAQTRCRGSHPYLCVPDCDPLAQDCDSPNDICVQSGADGFVCVLDASGGAAPHGTPCEYVNTCNPGLLCVAPDRVDAPACATASGCCASVCNTNGLPDCDSSLELCVSLEVPGSDVGVCMIPEGP